MGFLKKDEAFQKFLKLGHNSSHFVWFITEMQYYETENGWVFGFVQTGRVTIFALEPLMPASSTNAYPENFQQAWQEIQEKIQPQISLFVSIYEPFMKLLRANKFQALQVGKEPYVNLKDCIPTGKSGKGVRAARNQALRAGVQVEEWNKEKILAHPLMKKNMEQILLSWKSKNLINIGGFLNAVDPFAEMEHRRYFLAFNQGKKLEAFLVATPIPGKNSYFLEDMVVRPGATRGAGELLTLEAMVTLSESQAELASLGVVSTTSMGKNSSIGLPKLVEFVTTKIPKYYAKFYNVRGLEVFRKRFKPHFWENIFIALKNEKTSGLSDTAAWFLSFAAMIHCFKPQLNFSLHWLKGFVIRPLIKYPAAYTVTILSTVAFCFINKGGELPNWALDQLGFSGSAPFLQWFYRSITSDFLYFDRTHFIVSIVALFTLIRWMERTHKFEFVVGFIFMISFLDDFINHYSLIKPFEYFHPVVFQKLIAVKDVGGSLWIATFIGLQICQIKKNREILFTIVAVGSVLCFAFSSNHLANLALNLNHFLFLAIGFIVGKLKFEHEREVSRQVARQKPPQAKSVAISNTKHTHLSIAK